MPLLVGTESRDIIQDTAEHQDIQALGGDDQVGMDYPGGSPANRMIDGGAGFDYLLFRTEDFGISPALSVLYHSFNFDVATGKAIGEPTGSRAGFTISFTGFERYIVAATANYSSVTTGSADDRIDIRSAIQATISGGAGNDGLSVTGVAGASASQFAIFGGDGDDGISVTGLPASHTIDGGAGNDRLTIHDDEVARGLNITGIETIIGSFILSETAMAAGETITADNKSHTGARFVDARASLNGQIVFYGAQGNDTVYGTARDDLMAGNDGRNLLSGGAGNDIYVVASLQDIIEEAPGAGNDIVYTSVNFTLTGTAAIETLSAQNQRAESGLKLIGNGFAQQVVGDFGNNILNGNGGADTLIGLRGNDIYAIADANAVIIENAGEGHDIVYTHVSYALTGLAEVEELSFATQQAAEDLNLIGNGFNQQVVGNFGNNVLNGNGGIDTLIGLRGNDVYVVGNAASTAWENPDEGNDTVFANVSYTLLAGASIESLSTQTHGGTETINLKGNEVAQTVVGNNGANVLDGGAGSDTLHGLAGADTFAFSTAPGASNVDTLADFGNGADRMQLSAGVFTGLSAGTLAAGAFATGTAATTADQRIVYDQATGRLFFDLDGSGAGGAVQFAAVAAGTIVTAEMIGVV